MKLLRELIKKNNQLLSVGDFSAYIEGLVELGKQLETDFVQDVQRGVKGTFPEEINKKKRFFRSIDYYFNLKFLTFSSEKSLSTRLWNLKAFLIAWDDPVLRQQLDKQLHQSIKLKAEIDKSFRQPIHAALIAEVIRLQTEVSHLLEGQEFPAINFDGELNAELIQCLCDCIRTLESKIPDDIDQIYDQAAKAIATFKPRAERFFHGLSIIIGLLAALACGLATGGFLFLLVSSFGAPLWAAILVGSLMCAASLYANFGLFSKLSSKILCTMIKSGSITEFIDRNGQRKQLSVPIKYLLVVGALFSVGVGLSSASLTILFGLTLISTLFPSLTMIVPAILISALVFGLTMGLSLIIFNAWVDLVKKIRTKFSSWKDFSEALIEQIKAIKNLNVSQFLGYLFQAAFMGFAVFGLFFLCFTGVPSLVPVFTPIGSWIVGLAAFLGDLPFTILTVSSFCHGFMQLFSRTHVSDAPESEALPEPDKPSLLSRVGHVLLLAANAAGRSIQVFNGKLISAISAIACFFSALAGTLMQADNSEEASRTKANQDNKKLLVQEDYKMAESANSVISNNERRDSNLSFTSAAAGVFFSRSSSPINSSSASTAELQTSIKISC